MAEYLPLQVKTMERLKEFQIVSDKNGSRTQASKAELIKKVKKIWKPLLSEDRYEELIEDVTRFATDPKGKGGKSHRFTTTDRTIGTRGKASQTTGLIQTTGTRTRVTGNNSGTVR